VVWNGTHERFRAPWSQVLAGFATTAAAATAAWVLAPALGYLSLLLFLIPTIAWAYLFGTIGGLASTAVILPLSLFAHVQPGPFGAPALGFVFWGFCAAVGSFSGYAFSRAAADRSLKEEIHQLRRSLHGSQKEFTTLIHRLPIPYLRVDPSGIVRTCNAMAEQVLGVAFGTLKGTPLSAFLSSHVALDDTGLVRFLTGDTLELLTIHGDTTPIEWRSEVIKDGKGRIAGFALFGADRADIRRLEREVMEAAVHAENEAGDRRAFVHAVRDEIGGYAKRVAALSGGLAWEEGAKAHGASRISAVAADLSETLRSLAEMFEPERGPQLREDGFELRSTLEESARAFVESYRLGVLEYDHAISEDVPSFVWGDQSRLRRALNHAFFYVVESMRAGRIYLEARCETSGASESVLRVHFSASDPTQALFAPASAIDRIPETVAERIRLHGVPFAAMVHLVEQLGGEVSVFASKDISTLTLEFPFRVISRPDALPRAGRRRVKVALHGDPGGLAEALQRIGYVVTLAGNPYEEMDNVELVVVNVHEHREHNARGMGENFRIAVGDDGPNRQADYLAGGFDAYVRSGSNPDQIAAEIDDVYWNQSPTRSSVPADLEKLELKTTVSERVLRIFVQDMPGKMEGLERAMRGRDLGEAAALLHSIADYVSVTRMRVIANRCADLEKAARQNRYIDLISELPDLKRLIEKLLDNIRDVLKSPAG
jgi:HPt (histidine-containing phosphotransfer) domain-containing protein/PAS domain-containing protein